MPGYLDIALKGSEQFMDGIKDAINSISQGVYVIGTKYENKINGATAAWITQISSRPCSVLVAIGKTHYTAELIQQTGCFSINVLSENNRELAVQCGFSSGRNRDKLAGINVEYAVTGAPLIAGVKAHLDCKLLKTIEDGDHTLFIGEVVYGKEFEGNALIYHKKEFFK